MSSFAKRISKPKKVPVRKVRQAIRERCTREYTSFNIFTREGENLVVHSRRPMTVVEAQYIYGALSISGID